MPFCNVDSVNNSQWVDTQHSSEVICGKPAKWSVARTDVALLLYLCEDHGDYYKNHRSDSVFNEAIASGMKLLDKPELG